MHDGLSRTRPEKSQFPIPTPIPHPGMPRHMEKADLYRRRHFGNGSSTNNSTATTTVMLTNPIAHHPTATITIAAATGPLLHYDDP